MTTASLVSIQVGRPKTYGDPSSDDPLDQPWTSAFFKDPVTDPDRVGELGVEGDGHANAERHGGIDRAVLAYSGDHYDDWQRELGIDEIPFGGFAENFTIRGLTEDAVCLGDIWRVGDIRTQVSQPRQPCWKMGRRFRRKDLPALVVKTGRSGWYLRVLDEGILMAGAEVALVERPHPQWTVARAAATMYGEEPERLAVAELLAMPELSALWKNALLS